MSQSLGWGLILPLPLLLLLIVSTYIVLEKNTRYKKWNIDFKLLSWAVVWTKYYYTCSTDKEIEIQNKSNQFKIVQLGKANLRCETRYISLTLSFLQPFLLKFFPSSPFTWAAYPPHASGVSTKKLALHTSIFQDNLFCKSANLSTPGRNSQALRV